MLSVPAFLLSSFFLFFQSEFILAKSQLAVIFLIGMYHLSVFVKHIPFLLGFTFDGTSHSWLQKEPHPFSFGEHTVINNYCTPEGQPSPRLNTVYSLMNCCRGVSPLSLQTADVIDTNWHSKFDYAAHTVRVLTLMGIRLLVCTVVLRSCCAVLIGLRLLC